MIDDVQAFAVYAPFYDAFSVDRRFAHVLRTSPMTDRLPSDTAIFASNELHLLESWLLDVETRTPAGHFDLAASMAPAGLSRTPAYSALWAGRGDRNTRLD